MSKLYKTEKDFLDAIENHIKECGCSLYCPGINVEKSLILYHQRLKKLVQRDYIHKSLITKPENWIEKKEVEKVIDEMGCYDKVERYFVEELKKRLGI